MKKRIVSLMLIFSILLSTLPLGTLKAFAQNNILYGDADGNGKVDMSDVNLMGQYMDGDAEAQAAIYLTEADVNADSVVNSDDVELVKEYLAGNIQLTDDLCTVSFDTDGGGEIGPIKVGKGYAIMQKIPSPGKDGETFVGWQKENGTDFYQTEPVTGDMTLRAIYETMDVAEQVYIDSFALTDQKTDLEIGITAPGKTAEQVKAAITLLTKDGSDPVNLVVTDNGGGSFAVYGDGGFRAGGTYEMTLGDGLTFTDRDERYRTVALTFAKEAFRLSEEYHTPILLRMCTRISHSQSIVEKGERQEVPKREYVKDPLRVMMTTNSMKAHHRVEERTAAMTELAETTFLNRMEMGEDTSIGIITSSTSYQYVREVFGDKACVLKLGLSWPMPVQKIQDFAAQVDKVLVVEELEPIIENHCRQIGVAVSGKDVLPMIDELTQGVVARCLGRPEKETVTLEDEIPGRPPVMCAGCPHRGVFYALKRAGVYVSGDIGCYTLAAYEPLYAIETCECMGASVSSIHGFNKALGAESEHKTVAVIGDSTFMHSGMTGLANIAYNRSNSTVFILDNSITGMTGHQNNPANGYDIHGEPTTSLDILKLCDAMGIKHVRVVDPFDVKELEKVVREETEREELSVIISRRPCALIVKQPGTPFICDTTKCKNCGMCMKIGCPAIRKTETGVAVDPTQCVGCGLCEQLCHFGALHTEA